MRAPGRAGCPRYGRKTITQGIRSAWTPAGPDRDRAADDRQRGARRRGRASPGRPPIRPGRSSIVAGSTVTRRELELSVSVSGRVETLWTREPLALLPALAVPRAERRATSATRRPRPRSHAPGSTAPPAAAVPAQRRTAAPSPRAGSRGLTRRDPGRACASSAAAPATAAAATLVPVTDRVLGLAVAGRAGSEVAIAIPGAESCGARSPPKVSPRDEKRRDAGRRRRSRAVEGRPSVATTR